MDVIKHGQVVFVSPKVKSAGFDCKQHCVVSDRQAVAALLVGGGDVKAIGNSDARKRRVRVIEFAIVVVVDINHAGGHGQAGFGFFNVRLASCCWTITIDRFGCAVVGNGSSQALFIDCRIRCPRFGRFDRKGLCEAESWASQAGQKSNDHQPSQTLGRSDGLRAVSVKNCVNLWPFKSAILECCGIF